MDKHLAETKLLNYSNPVIERLIKEKQWKALPEKDKILGIYNFVRDDIAFGYNRADGIPASEVLSDGYGQCNTKGILFMALLRAAGVPCRMHGFTIDKKLQKGALKGFYYKLSPAEILHSWVEVCYNGKWLNIEGFILDIQYLKKLQAKFSDCSGSFCGYGVATNDFKSPNVYWDENNTYIQKEGIVKDFGVYDSPDELFEAHRQNLSLVKALLYKYIIRRLMNRNIRIIRKSHTSSAFL